MNLNPVDGVQRGGKRKEERGDSHVEIRRWIRQEVLMRREARTGKGGGFNLHGIRRVGGRDTVHTRKHDPSAYKNLLNNRSMSTRRRHRPNERSGSSRDHLKNRSNHKGGA